MPWDENRPSMTEVELLARFIEHMRLGEETARGLAHSRKDMRWIRIARLLSEVNEKASEVAVTRMAS